MSEADVVSNIADVLQQVQAGNDIVVDGADRAVAVIKASGAAQPAQFDFYAPLNAEELARAQGVGPIRQASDIPRFENPDPDEAEWFAREIRRWRKAPKPRKTKR